MAVTCFHRIPGHGQGHTHDGTQFILERTSRLKFLKSARAEGAAVTDMVTRLALGHPSVAVTLHLDERTTIDLAPEQGLKDRCAETLGRQLAEGLLAVEGVADATQLQGFVAHPQYAKPSAKKQYVYLNGRPVQDRMITAAIREGFAGFLEPRLHGVVILYVDTDPSLIDVNVHPTKAEIRFRRQGEVFALIRDSIKKVLAEHSGGFRLDGVAGISSRLADVKRQSIRSAVPRENRRTLFSRALLPREPSTYPQTTVMEPINETLHTAQSPTPQTVAETNVAYDASTAQASAREHVAVQTSTPDLPGIRKVVQLGDMYVLVETEEGIRLLDQHALHEKALYLCLEGDVREFEKGGRQELLIPQTIELDASEMAAVEPHLPALAESGIEAEVFGPCQLILRAHPSSLQKISWQRF